MTDQSADPSSRTRKFLRTQFSGDGLRARAMRGSALTVLQFGGSNVLRLASNLILTRILFPDAFGLMALVTVVLTGLQMFSDVGIRPAIIQNRRGDDPAFLNTAWTLQIGRGVLLWLVACALAQPMAAFYEEPMLAQMLPVAGLSPLIMGFNSTRLATTNRHLVLGRVTVLELGSQAIMIVVMVALALALQSVWALVLGTLVGSTARLVLSHTILPGQPNRLCFEREAFGQLLGFGKYIFLGTIAGFLISQGDRAVLGKYVPLAELAVYNIAFFLASAPQQLIKAMGERILFPLYTQRPPTESEENRRKIFRSRILMTGAGFAATAVLAVSGDWLVGVLYDSRYQGAGPLLVLIALALLPTIITTSYPALFLMAGDSGRYAFFISLKAAVRLGFTIVGAATLGAAGVPVAMVLAEIVTYPLMVAMIRPYRGWDMRHDGIFALIAVVVSLVVIWVNADALNGLFETVQAHVQTGTA